MSNIGTQIKGYERYVITTKGEVYSLLHNRTRKLKPQKATQSKKGYYQVRLFNEENPSGKLQYIHRIVYETFVGEITKGMEIDHIDTDTSNNSIDNIQAISRRSNIKKYNTTRYGMDMRVHRDELIKDYQELGTYKAVGEKWNKNQQVIYRTIKNLTHYYCTKAKKFKTRIFDKNINDDWMNKDQRYKNRFGKKK
tara:strand:- start:705 stop:1289 length:585 start_codon:yes stop_codon:yes gene_type:complete